MEKKKIQVLLFFILTSYIKSLTVLDHMYSEINARTDKSKPICPLNFFEVGGIKK